MLKIVGSAPCAGTHVQGDPWVPLKVAWLPVEPRQPLYLRVSGCAGGELEFKVDPVTGSLSQFILLLPSNEIGSVPELGFSCSEESAMVPIIDRSIWAKLAGRPDDFVPGSIVRAEGIVTVNRASNGMVVGVGDAQPVNFMRAGDVEVGYAADGELVSVLAVFDAQTA